MRSTVRPGRRAFQDLKIADAQRLGTGGPLLRVAELELGRAMVLRSDDGNWVWAFSIDPVGLGAGLISRNRIAVPDAGRLARAGGPAPLAAGAGHRHLPDELGTTAFGRPDVERPVECDCAFSEVG